MPLPHFAARHVHNALDDFVGTFRFGEDWFVANVTVGLENRGDHLILRYLDGDSAGYEMIMVPLGGRRFFDRTHGGLFHFEPAKPGAPRALIYEFGNQWRAVQVEE